LNIKGTDKSGIISWEEKYSIEFEKLMNSIKNYLIL
jgi:hypothetical protein